MNSAGITKSIFCALVSFLCLYSTASSQWTDTLFMSVYFATDHSTLTQSQERDIQLFIESIPDLDHKDKIHIKGQADYRGTSEYNLALSEKRAVKVHDFLKRLPINALNQMTILGIGETPATLNLHEERRVDIIVYNHRNAEAQPILVDDFEKLDPSILHTGTTLRINNLLFTPGRSILLPESIPHLKALEKFLRLNPEIHIRIEGHVCCIDQLRPEKDGYDQDAKKHNLSEGRAKNIYNYLVRNDISPDRLEHKGMGGLQPTVYPELSEEDAKQNRRVEIIITSLQ